MAFPVGNADSVEYYAKTFRSYDMMIDGSLIPVIFLLGLVLVFIMQFVQMKSFFTNGKGNYTLFTLPMQRREVYFSFLIALTAAVAVYYLLWLVLLFAAYFPVTAFNEAAAAKETLYISEGVTLTGIETHIENGLFLAFRRSVFLSTCFPGNLWHGVPFLAGLMLIETGILYACFRTGHIGNCIIVSFLSILGGIYLFAATFFHDVGFPIGRGGFEGEVFLGKGMVMGLIGIIAIILLQFEIVTYLEERLEL